MSPSPSSSRTARRGAVVASSFARASLAAFILAGAAVPLADAHESCCEATKRARAARRLHTVVLSKSTEACPWLLLGLLTIALLAAAKLPVGAIKALLTTDGNSGSKNAKDAAGGGSGGRRLLESVRLTLFAAFLGLITPLCSCGALPLASGLLAAGADLRAVVAFLTAAQSAGLDSAAVTVGMLGWRVAAFRLVGSVILAVASGVAVGMGGQGRRAAAVEKCKDDHAGEPPTLCCSGSSDGASSEEKKCDDHCCPTDAAPTPAPTVAASEKSVGETMTDKEKDKPSQSWLRTFLRSLVSTFDEIWPVLLFGVVVTACVEKLWTGDSLPLQPPHAPHPAPPGWDEEDDGPWDDGSSEDPSFLASIGLPPWAIDFLVRTAVVAAALPLQLCEHGVVSFAAALERAGATPGTAHAFLLSAPATNAASLGVLVRASSSGGGAGGYGGPGAALRGAAGIAATAVALSYVADRPDVLGGTDEEGNSNKIGDAVETFSLPGWFADVSVYVCGALLAASLVSRASKLLKMRGANRGAVAAGGRAHTHVKTD